MKTRYTEST